MIAYFALPGLVELFVRKHLGWCPRLSPLAPLGHSIKEKAAEVVMLSPFSPVGALNGFILNVAWNKVCGSRALLHGERKRTGPFDQGVLNCD